MEKIMEYKPKPSSYHIPGVRWRYSDGTILMIGKDGVARREEPKQFRTKKERKKARAAAKEKKSNV